MAADYSIHIHFASCLHRHVVPVTTGGLHFSEGEVWDDIHEHLQCLDCMEYLTEAEIRARWNGTDDAGAGTTEKEDKHVPY